MQLHTHCEVNLFIHPEREAESYLTLPADNVSFTRSQEMVQIEECVKVKSSAIQKVVFVFKPTGNCHSRRFPSDYKGKKGHCNAADTSNVKDGLRRAAQYWMGVKATWYKQQHCVALSISRYFAMMFLS
jgi:hypothetical protein